MLSPSEERVSNVRTLNDQVPGWDADLAAFRETTPFHADAIVVGTGPGASVAILRLAQAGKKVLALERGQWWTYPDRPYGVGRHALWMPARGVFGHHEFRFLGRTVTFRLFGWTLRFSSKLLGTVIAWVGSGVGGGTHVWAKTLIRATSDTLKGTLPPEIIPETLDEHYYPVVEKMMGVTPYPEYPPYSQVPKTTVMQAMGRAMEKTVSGARGFALPLAIRFAQPGQPMGQDSINEFGTLRRTYDLREPALLRGDWGTTNTTDSNYLAEAVKTGNAKILALHQADKIEELPGGGYRVHAACLSDMVRDKVGSKRTAQFTSKALFLGAGSLGTTELLLRNAVLYKTLTRLSPRLGTRYGTNGDRLGLAATERLDQPDLGPTNTWGVEFPDSAGKPAILIIDGGYPHPLTMIVLTILDALGIRSPRLQSRLIRMQRWMQKHVTRRLSILSPIPLLGMNAENCMEGQIQLDGKGRLIVNIRLRDNAGPDRKMDERMALMARAVSPRRGILRRINRFFLHLPRRIYRTIQKTEVPHNLGGAPMGKDVHEGVVNHFGKVHGYEGLYLVDASVLPPVIGRNPVGTIMGLAERAMTYILFPEHQKLLQESLLRVLGDLPEQMSREALLEEVRHRLETEREALRQKETTAIALRPEGKLWRAVLDSLQEQVGNGAPPPAELAQFLRELSQQWRDRLSRLTPQELAALPRDLRIDNDTPQSASVRFPA